MQRPFFSQSPKRVGSGPGGPPNSRGATGRVAADGGRDESLSSEGGAVAAGAAALLRSGVDIPIKSARIP